MGRGRWVRVGHKAEELQVKWRVKIRSGGVSEKMQIIEARVAVG
jgi:hypothetical protein